MSTSGKVYIGIDVAKRFLDVAIYPINKNFRVANSLEGIGLIVDNIAAYSVQIIVCEASGGYESLMLKSLGESGYRVWRVDPKRIKAFIVSQGTRVKTDAIDAQMMSLFAAKNEPQYEPLVLSDQQEALRELVRHRFSLISIVSEEKNRLQQLHGEVAQIFIKKHIEYVDQQVNLVEIEIDKLIESNLLWKRKSEIIESIPGLGKNASRTLIAEVPELGTIDNKKAAALIGVAPFTKQSGSVQRASIIQGGRFMARHALYMSALYACRGEGKFGKFYIKLTAGGKKPKVALVAVMNKMVGVTNTLLKKNEIWNPIYDF